MSRPITTLFMLMSVDGKISSGDTDIFDFDRDFPKIIGIKEGLHQYYELEQQTDLFSLNSGRVLAKIGINKKVDEIPKTPVTFLIIDNKPHLNTIGIDNLLEKSEHLFIITTNKNHPAFNRKRTENMTILLYENTIDFSHLFQRLRDEFGIKSLTIQTGGELNSVLLKNKLIDKVSIVVAPALVGGQKTTSLIGGLSIHSMNELQDIKALKLDTVDILKDSYINLKYTVINETEI